MAISPPTGFVLPDLLASCPLKDATNPYYKEAGAESAAWINSYRIFTDQKRAFFVQNCNELLVSHVYPYAGYEQFRTCCDFVNLLFVFDEISDDQSGNDARMTGEIFLHSMRDPDWHDQSVLAKITKDFRTRFFRLAGPNSARRFLKHCEDYIESVAIEAELRERSEVLDIDSFTTLRRENSAVRLCFGLVEYVLGIDLPQEVFEDPMFMDIYWTAADMVCWANDLYSYNMEQAKGHTGNNIITVLMKAKGIDLQAASDYVGAYFKELMNRHLAARANLRSWDPSVDRAVAHYVEATAHWARGNLDWSFETPRYFGVHHQEVKASLLVTLQPADYTMSTTESDSEEGQVLGLSTVTI